ncbi:histidine phosphatase family protein [Pseudonocardia humida]|uniref:Histidine phosphatase family protein n=1 Tax=Pseudonocardia humida TaxID=2800819 RepID=A0ABT1A4R3_9PSEU|nr:histidine phosphatase family protein [Pseudonocardia humida]MCO1657933.1 histidine phosphatase family protein [Pseudonocardia humida]
MSELASESSAQRELASESSAQRELASESSAQRAPRLVLVRHGQTAANVIHALDTRPPGAPLTELGHAQAAALAERLRVDPVVGGPISAVHASTATRAQQTAAPLAAALGLEVQVVDGAHEIFVGDLENRSDVEARERFEEVYAAWGRGDLDAHLPGGESAQELRDRFTAAVEKITGPAAGPVAGTVVLVSHGAAIRLGAAALLGDVVETAYLGNTGIVVLSAIGSGDGSGQGGGWELVHWDPAPPRPGDVTAGGEAD